MFDNSSKPKVKRDLSNARDLREPSNSRDKESMDEFFKKFGIENGTKEMLGKASVTFLPKHKKDQD